MDPNTWLILLNLFVTTVGGFYLAYLNRRHTRQLQIQGSGQALKVVEEVYSRLAQLEEAYDHLIHRMSFGRLEDSGHDYELLNNCRMNQKALRDYYVSHSLHIPRKLKDDFELLEEYFILLEGYYRSAFKEHYEFDHHIDEQMEEIEALKEKINPIFKKLDRELRKLVGM